MHRGAEQISADTENRRPDDSSGGVEEEEARPRHAVGTGEQSGKRAQQSRKSAEEDDRASVTTKKILPEFEPSLVEPDASTIAHQERKSYEPTDLIADVVADHSAGRRSGNDADDIKFVARAGVDRSRNECSLAGQRKTHALEADQNQDG